MSFSFLSWKEKERGCMERRRRHARNIEFCYVIASICRIQGGDIASLIAILCRVLYPCRFFRSFAFISYSFRRLSPLFSPPLFALGFHGQFQRGTFILLLHSNALLTFFTLNLWTLTKGKAGLIRAGIVFLERILRGKLIMYNI